MNVSRLFEGRSPRVLLTTLVLCVVLSLGAGIAVGMSSVSHKKSPPAAATTVARRRRAAALRAARARQQRLRIEAELRRRAALAKQKP